MVFEDEDDDNNNFNNQQVEEEEEELQPKQQPQSAAAPAMDALDSREQEELRGLLESLDDFRDEVEVARHHPKVSCPNIAIIRLALASYPSSTYVLCHRRGEVYNLLRAIG